jgi:hypothetical protein
MFALGFPLNCTFYFSFNSALWLLARVSFEQVEDLKTALKEVLDQRGVLGQLKARIRAEVFNALDEQVM